MRGGRTRANGTERIEAVHLKLIPDRILKLKQLLGARKVLNLSAPGSVSKVRSQGYRKD